jgi:(2Fe-2S) ferredoxin
MPSFQRHVFVCVNERPPGNPKGCCKAKGADQVRDEFKKRLYELGLKGQVRANNSGCLDQCANGVTVVVYPEQVWYGHVTVADVPEIIERHILKGEFVERLMLPDQPHLHGATSAPPLVRLQKK